MAMGESYFRHFPAGTYYEQTATELGKLEIDLMRDMERLWLVFFVKDADTYSSDDLKYIGWLEDDRRAKRLNRVLAALWEYDLKQHVELYPKLSN